MRTRTLSKGLIAISAILALAAPGAARAQAAPFCVLPGYDLLQTDPTGTIFMGVNFKGVPLGTFDFGKGPVATGLTDTIVQRLQTATAPGGGSSTINIQLVALQLESVTPVNGHNLFATLDQQQASTGAMTINFNGAGTGGTFSSFFDVFFDLHVDSLNGPLAMPPVDLQLSSSGDAWGRTPPAGAEIIDGVNNHLDGKDNVWDFWVPGEVQHDASGAAKHLVKGALTGVPEPSTMAFLMAGLMAGGGFARRRTRRA
jgi:hypothetical protein